MTKTKHMRFGYLILAGFFLLNPIIGVRDFLPDLFGYFLLFFGLSKLADLSDLLSDAQKAMKAMIWVGAGQLLANALVNGFLKNSGMELNRYEQPVWSLLFAFVFLVLEWYFMLPAWRSFFEGLSSIAGHSSGTSRMISLTRWFVILKTLLCVLPEATVLTSFESDTGSHYTSFDAETGTTLFTDWFTSFGADAGNSVFTFDWYTYVAMFRTIAIVISLVFGVLWWIAYMRWLNRLRTDSELQQRLCEQYDAEILPDVGFLLNRRVNTSFAFFRVAAFFAASLMLSYRECLPDWVAAVLFLVGILMLGTFFPYIKRCSALAVLVAAVSVLKMFFNEQYLKDFVPMDSRYLPTAYEQYQPIRLLGIAEAVLMLLLLGMIVFGFRKLSFKLLSDPAEHQTDAFSRSGKLQLCRALLLRTIPVFVFITLSCICKILENELQFAHGWFWILQFLVSITTAILFSSFLSELSDAIREQYPPKRNV